MRGRMNHLTTFLVVLTAFAIAMTTVLVVVVAGPTTLG